jgi:hypothetical protein
LLFRGITWLQTSLHFLCADPARGLTVYPRLKNKSNLTPLARNESIKKNSTDNN